MAEIAEADAFIVERFGEEFHKVGHWELEFSVLPYVRERITNLASISTLLVENQVTLRGGYFPHFDQPSTSNFARGVQSYMKRSSSGHLEGYRAYQSGTFVWRGTLWEDVIKSMSAGQKALSFVGVILSITEYFLFARRYYEKFAPDATMKLVIGLTDTQDRILASFNINEGYLHGEYICKEPRIDVETTCTVAELGASYDELARKAIRRVYELFNWNNSGEEIIRDWQERLMNRRL